MSSFVLTSIRLMNDKLFNLFTFLTVFFWLLNDWFIYFLTLFHTHCLFITWFYVLRFTSFTDELYVVCDMCVVWCGVVCVYKLCLIHLYCPWTSYITCYYPDTIFTIVVWDLTVTYPLGSLEMKRQRETDEARKKCLKYHMHDSDFSTLNEWKCSATTSLFTNAPFMGFNLH